MTKKNTFISWSGAQAKHVARALHGWLPLVVPACEPFVSDIDVASGSRWFSTIQDELEGAKFGVAVLSPENVEKPWVMFEVGALAKGVGQVTPYCIGGLAKEKVGGPLGNIQGLNATEEDTGDLVRDLAAALDDEHLDRVKDRFTAFWPQLEEKLDSMPALEEGAPENPDAVRSMLEEILQLSRATAREVSQLKPEPTNVNPAAKLARLLSSAEEFWSSFSAQPEVQLLQRATAKGIKLHTSNDGPGSGSGVVIRDLESGQELVRRVGDEVAWSDAGRYMAALLDIEVEDPPEK